MFTATRGDSFIDASVDEMAKSMPFLTNPQHSMLYIEHLYALGLLRGIANSGGGPTLSRGPYAGMQEMHFDLKLSTMDHLLATTALKPPS